MGAMASQITSLTIVYSTVYSGADQRKHQSSASLALVRGIHQGPVNSPHKRPVTRKMFPFDDVTMITWYQNLFLCCYVFMLNIWIWQQKIIIFNGSNKTALARLKLMNILNEWQQYLLSETWILPCHTKLCNFINHRSVSGRDDFRRYESWPHFN